MSRTSTISRPADHPQGRLGRSLCQALLFRLRGGRPHERDRVRPQQSVRVEAQRDLQLGHRAFRRDRHAPSTCPKPTSWSRTATSPPTISAPSPSPTRCGCGAHRTRASSRARASPKKPPPCSPRANPDPRRRRLTRQTQRRHLAALRTSSLLLMSLHPLPCATLINRILGERGRASSLRLALLRSSGCATAGSLPAPRRDDPCARNKTQEIDRSGPSSAFLAKSEAMSPWLPRAVRQRSGLRRCP